MSRSFSILVPLDGSSLADLALPYVERLAPWARHRGQQMLRRARDPLLVVHAPAVQAHA